MADLSELPALERIQRYLDLADDARQDAERCKGVRRESYLRIADHWESLARDAGKRLNSANAVTQQSRHVRSWSGEWLRQVK